MKGIVFSFGNRGRKSSEAHPQKKIIPRVQLEDFRFYLRRYAVTSVLALLLLGGLALGSVFAAGADADTIRSLDFLFTTNLESRLSQGAIGIFCACFASDFIFLVSVYLFGTAPWGLPFLFSVVFFKGFGTGITAAYLFLTHSLSGLGFYLLVLLPGTFLFCAALIRFSARAFEYSRLAFLGAVSKAPSQHSPRAELMRFSSGFLSALIAVFFAAVLDTLLWSLFAGTFQF